MQYHRLPVAVVESWIFIELSKNEDLKHAKYNANQAIIGHFGSVERAQMYVDESKNAAKID